jgi:hypothetical protein
MTTRPPFRDRDELLRWLDGMRPADLVHTGRLLGEGVTARAVAARADQAIYEMTRTASQAAVAAELGLSAKQVKRAVEQHAARLRAEAAGQAST